MSLTTRLSVFFLSALAVVLAGFSVTLYALAHQYLQQGHERPRFHISYSWLSLRNSE